MTDFADLLARVREAKGPDRDLDAAIALATGWTHEVNHEEDYECWRKSDGKAAYLPRYTASIDAALALVERMLPGKWPLILDTATAIMWATESRIEFSGSKIDLSRLPLAILAALLSALSSPTLNSEDK